MLLKLPVLLHAQPPIHADGYFFYEQIVQLLNFILYGNAFAYTFLTIILLFAQAIYFKSIASRHKLYPRTTYLPAVSYILLTSVFPAFNYFSVTLLLNWCLLAGIDIILSFSNTQQPRKQLFNAGFILCVAFLLQFSAIGYILVLFMGIGMLRSFNAGEWVVGAMGYFTPFYFFAGILFLVDRLSIISQWPHFGLSLPTHVSSAKYFIISISGILILFALGIFAMQQQIAKNSVFGRRVWTVIIVYFIISLVVAVFTDGSVKSAWLLLVPALSMIITHAISLEKSKRFSNFTFYFFLVLVLACQLAIK